MSAADHLRFQVLILDTDTELVEETVRAHVEPAGHPVESVRIVGLGELRGALNEALDRRGVILLCGGTHQEARPAMRRVRGQLEDELPGFAEVFRYAAYARIGAAAMFTDATAGFTAEGTPVFAVPGPAGALRIALEGVILPGLHALQPGALLGWPHPEEDPEDEALAAEVALRQARAHGLLDDPGDEAPTEMVSVTLGELRDPDEAEEPSLPGEADEPSLPAQPSLQQTWGLSEPAPYDLGVGELGKGWKAAVKAFRASVDKKDHPFLPDAFMAMVRAREYLGTAGEKGVMTLPDGRRYGIFGWPDLRGPSSKVLIIGAGEPVPEIVALHRFPEQVGTCVYGEGGMLPSADLLPDPYSEERTGFPLKEWGQLFGLGVHTVYVQRDGRVVSWNGMRERDQGAPGPAVAELIKEWSKR